MKTKQIEIKNKEYLQRIVGGAPDKGLERRPKSSQNLASLIKMQDSAGAAGKENQSPEKLRSSRKLFGDSKKTDICLPDIRGGAATEKKEITGDFFIEDDESDFFTKPFTEDEEFVDRTPRETKKKIVEKKEVKGLKIGGRGYSSTYLEKILGDEVGENTELIHEQVAGARDEEELVAALDRKVTHSAAKKIASSHLKDRNKSIVGNLLGVNEKGEKNYKVLYHSFPEIKKKTDEFEKVLEQEFWYGKLILLYRYNFSRKVVRAMARLYAKTARGIKREETERLFVPMAEIKACAKRGDIRSINGYINDGFLNPTTKRGEVIRDIFLREDSFFKDPLEGLGFKIPAKVK